MKKMYVCAALILLAAIILSGGCGPVAGLGARRPAENKPQEVLETSGPPAPESPSSNLALNRSRSGYPKPTESHHGWGGGSDKWETVDGKRYYEDWQHGLAFTGGMKPYHEQAGWRQATIDFGKPTTFNRVLVWHHGLEHVPRRYKIQYQNGSSWVDIFSTQSGHDYLKYPADPADEWYEDWSTPTENMFEAVTSNKVRFLLENSDIVHGWIYEFEVYYDIR